jgi:hypothetical protein
MIETTATYFDGISSVAHPVTVMLNEADASLQFTTHTGKKEWRIALVTYHTVGNMTELPHCSRNHCPDYRVQYFCTAVDGRENREHATRKL